MCLGGYMFSLRKKAPKKHYSSLQTKHVSRRCRSSRTCCPGKMMHADGGSHGEEEFTVNVTYQSMIKPSSPTPPNRRQFKLSFIDRFMPPEYYSTIFLSFYPTPPPSPAATTLLRHSLSKTLSHFYPLAGRIRVAVTADGNSVPSSSIDCNDEGVVYFEAQANQTMNQFLATTTPPSRQILQLHLAPPRPRISPSSAPHDVVHVQVLPMATVKITVFQCGGIAIGVSLSQVIADAHTFGMLLKKWAAVTVAAGSSTTTPRDMAASLFLADEAIMSGTMLYMRERLQLLTSGKDHVNVVTQRLVFTGKAISGLIWKSAMDSRRALAALGKTMLPHAFAANSVVNLRPRLKIPLPDYCSMGNLCWNAAALHVERIKTVESNSGDDEDDDDDDDRLIKRLVSLLRSSIDKVDVDLVEKLQGLNAHHELHMPMEESARGTGNSLSLYSFTSILRIGLNEVDFGWGKPLWVSMLGFTEHADMLGLVCLMEATAGDDGAVEAWVSLDEQEMTIFEQNHHLLQYAIVNPRIICPISSKL